MIPNSDESATAEVSPFCLPLELSPDDVQPVVRSPRSAPEFFVNLFCGGFAIALLFLAATAFLSAVLSSWALLQLWFTKPFDSVAFGECQVVFLVAASVAAVSCVLFLVIIRLPERIRRTS